MYAVMALIDLGEFYLGQRRKAEAEAVADRAEKYCDETPIGEGRFSMLLLLSIFRRDLGDAAKNEALYARLRPMRRKFPFDPDLVWVEQGLAASAAAKGRFGKAEDHYREAIKVLDHDAFRKEEAGVLDDLADMFDQEGSHAADAAKARKQAEALRAGR